MANKINNIPQHKTVVDTPATPDLGFGRIYIKSDNQWYGLDDGGIETRLTSGINLTSLSANAPITYNNTNGTFSINQSNGSTNGYLSSTDWAEFNSKIGATSGTNNYIAKFTPNGTTIGNSLIRDDGTKIGINSAPVVGSKIYIISDQTAGINLNSNVSNINTAVGIDLSVSGTNNSANTGIVSNALNGNFTTTGVQGSASSSTGVNKGIEGIASGTSTNIGLRGYAVNGSSNYSIQLQDGTEAAGKFLKSVTNTGRSNWASITAADVSGVQGALTLTTTGSSGAATLIGNTLNIPQYSGGGGLSGSGTLNYLLKFTPDGITAGNSQIQDNGATLSIGTALEAATKLRISHALENGIIITNTLGGCAFSGISTGLSSISNISCGISGSGSGSAVNYGANFGATSAGLFNTGVYASAIGATSVNIGIHAYASGGSNTHAAQLQDGTEGTGKFLKSVTADGRTQWSHITSSDTTGASGSFVSDDGKTITVTNGLITSII